MRRILVCLLLLVVSWLAHAAQAPKSLWTPYPYVEKAAFAIFQTSNNSLSLPAANNLQANWQKSGLAVIGGIPTRNTQCGATVTPSGKTAVDPADDYNNIAAAIAACTVGQFVQLGTGTFNLFQSELPLYINKGITLRGNGATTTTVQTYDGPQPTYNSTPQCGVTIGSTTNCPNGVGAIWIGPTFNNNYGWGGCNFGDNPTTKPCGTKLTADAAQGATSVTVTSTANISVGMWVLVDEDPTYSTQSNPAGGTMSATPDLLLSSPSPVLARIANPDGSPTSCVYSLCDNRLAQEIHKITSIVGSVVTFDSPLSIGLRSSGSHDARLYWPTNASNVALTFVEQVGIENMTITRTNGGAIKCVYTAYCWASNVELSYWINGGFDVGNAVRNLLTSSYVHDCIDCQNNGTEYNIAIDGGSIENLIENNIITRGGKCMVGRGSGPNVVAYNYCDDTFYEMFPTSIGDSLLDMGINGSHYAGTHGWLFEGNRGPNCDGDNTHGSSSYHVFFKNNCTSQRTPFTDPSNSLAVNDCTGVGYTGFSGTINVANTPYPLRAAGVAGLSYWYAFVGNVLGTSAAVACTTYVYNSNSTGTQTNAPTMWQLGSNQAGNPADPKLYPMTSASYVFRHGNFDYVNAAIADWTSGYTHALPNSLYLSSTPSYFGPGATCTYTWPWVDPTSGTPVKSAAGAGSCTTYSGLPAKARMDAGTPLTQP